MPAARLSYIPWYPADYMAGKVRRGLTPPQRSAYIDILNECYLSEEGWIDLDYDDLALLTGVEMNDLRTVVERAFTQENGRITNERVQRELARMSELRDTARRAGKKSGEVRNNKKRKRMNGPSTVVHDSLNQQNRTEQNIAEASAPLGGARSPIPTPQSEPHTSPAPAPPAGSPSAPAAARPAPAPVEPPAPRWTPPTSPPPGARPAPVAPPPSMNSPERMRLLLDTCLATSHDNRDFARPWLNRTFGAMFNRLRGDEQVALEREFTARYGYGIDTGPQGHRTPVGPTNGTGEGVDRVAGAPARNGAGVHNGIDGPIYEPTEEAEVPDA